MRTKTEERRQLILDVADELFREVGFEKASMAEISARVGGSKATLYNYFASKSELFVAVMEEATARHFHHIFASLSHDEALEAVLLQFGVHYLQAALAPDVIRVHRMADHEAERSEVGRLLYENGIKRGWGQIAQFLSESMERGRLPAADAVVATWHLKGLLEAELHCPRMLGVLSDTPPVAELEQVAARAVTVWLRAYGQA